MYPSDDGSIRLRLLTAQCREVRQRMEQQITELQALRARSGGAGSSRPLSPPPDTMDPEDPRGEA